MERELWLPDFEIVGPPTRSQVKSERKGSGGSRPVIPLPSGPWPYRQLFAFVQQLLLQATGRHPTSKPTRVYRIPGTFPADGDEFRRLPTVVPTERSSLPGTTPDMVLWGGYLVDSGVSGEMFSYA